MYWLLYDIPDTRKRLKVVRLCKDSGLTRMQRSCFFGEIEKEALVKFTEGIEKLISSEDSVFLIPISQKVLEHTRIWGSAGEYKKEKAAICFF